MKTEFFASRRGAAPTWCYQGVICSGDFNVRAWTKDFAQIPILELMTERRRSWTRAAFPAEAGEWLKKDGVRAGEYERLVCREKTVYLETD